MAIRAPDGANKDELDYDYNFFFIEEYLKMAISLNFNPAQVHGFNGYHGPRHGAHHGHHDGWFFSDLYHTNSNCH